MDYKTKLMNFNHEHSIMKNVDLPSIQSMIIIITALTYHLTNNLHFQPNFYQFCSIILSSVGGFLLCAYFTKAKTPRLRVWHILVAIFVMVFIFNYDATVDAQMLEGLDKSLKEIGTASGSGGANNIIGAVVELARTAFFIVIIGCGVGVAVYGVMQGQWQATLLIAGVVTGIWLFIEMMGKAVYG